MQFPVESFVHLLALCALLRFYTLSPIANTRATSYHNKLQHSLRSPNAARYAAFGCC
jgi:hypothetical protein